MTAKGVEYNGIRQCEDNLCKDKSSNKVNKSDETKLIHEATLEN